MEWDVLRRQRDEYRERADECAREVMLSEPGSAARELAARDGLLWTDRAETISRFLGELPDELMPSP